MSKRLTLKEVNENLNTQVQFLNDELCELKKQQEGILQVLETDNISYSSLRRGAWMLIKFLYSRAKWFALSLFMAGAITEKRYHWIAHFLSFFK